MLEYLDYLELPLTFYFIGYCILHIIIILFFNILKLDFIFPVPSFQYPLIPFYCRSFSKIEHPMGIV